MVLDWQCQKLKQEAAVKDAETSHFYLGKISSMKKFEEFMDEDYEQEDQDKSISAFYDSQGEYYCDHDMMEVGIRKEEASLAEFFVPYSYSESWSEELVKRAEKAGLQDSNYLLFITSSEIKEPRSVEIEGFSLHYMGEIEYPI